VILSLLKPAYKLSHDEPASALRAEAKKIGDPEFEAKTGRHKAQRVILTENVEDTWKENSNGCQNIDRKRHRLNDSLISL
jgi:hypothetical protein